MKFSMNKGNMKSQKIKVSLNLTIDWLFPFINPL